MRASEAHSVVFHRFTNRSIADHIDLHPPWLDLLAMLNASRPDFRLLDIGAGSGRALLQLQAMYPAARLVGTNYVQWGQRLAAGAGAGPGGATKKDGGGVFIQSESSTDLFRDMF